jgi:hypothetical protein
MRAGRGVRSWLVAGTAAATAVVGLPAGAHAAATAATRTVSYGGITVRVPAAWPVVDLARRPGRCLLWNTHAVYLGLPSADERCPARAIGRASAVWLRPSAGGSVSDLASADAAPAALGTTDAGGADRQWTARAGSTLVTVAWGRSAVTARAVMASAHSVRHTVPASGSATGSPAPPAAAARPPAGAGTPATLAGEVADGRGFDACTVPPVSTMRAWLQSPYRVIGTYLGGVNWACTYGDFTPSWVTTVARMGWRYIPIYVGLQASCSTIPGVATIDPSRAASEGTAAARDAVADARAYGYGASSPIYFDMEGYDSADATCNQGVLDFLSAWTTGLHQLGYRSGVYSSAGSGIASLAAAYHTPGFSAPDAIWIGDWNGASGTADPYVPSAEWSHGQRLHQFYGGHDETWGGATVNVDDDTVAGPVAGPPSPSARSGRPLDLATGGADVTPSSLAVSPGQRGSATLRVTAPGPAPGRVSHWQAEVPSGIAVTPAAGTLAGGGARSTATLTVTAGAATAPGRYEVPVTATVGGRPVAETFLLVTVATPGGTVPTPAPLRLYAATPGDLAVASQLVSSMGLPAGDAVGSFSTAWSVTASGADLVLSAGAAADNALQTNPCGWANPAGEAAGSTPFFYTGDLDQQAPGADLYENSAGAGTAATAALTDLLATYALTGLQPNLGPHPIGAVAPTAACMGSPDS